jgi:hypothetical protein
MDKFNTNLRMIRSESKSQTQRICFLARETFQHLNGQWLNSHFEIINHKCPYFSTLNAHSLLIVINLLLRAPFFIIICAYNPILFLRISSG